MNSVSASVSVVVGTRAQLIKMVPVLLELDKRGIDYRFIYTAQHSETINEILSQFGCKQPDVVLYHRDEAKTYRAFFGWWGAMLKLLFNPKRLFPHAGLVLNHGDTATCAWGTIAGKMAGCRTGHIESGLRSFNIFKPFPEEILRLVTFRFTDVYFCPNEWAAENLKSYRGTKVNLGANTLRDVFSLAIQQEPSISRPEKRYAVVSIHRYENIFQRRFADTIIPLLELIAENGFHLVFILHPTTREVLKKNGGLLWIRLDKNENIELRERLPYIDFIHLLAGSAFVITDGGSNQEELSYMGKPTLLFREVTERVEGLNQNVLVSGFSKEKIDNFLRDYKNYEREKVTTEGSPSERLVDWIEDIWLNPHERKI